MHQYCDLHTHSTFSDGTFSPAEILAEANQLGLSAVALTDHNTVACLPEFLSAAQNGTVEAIPGVEITSSYGETELHIIGLFLPTDSFGQITSLLNEFNQRKEDSNLTLIQNLRRAGYALDYDEICRNHPDGTVNRAVIAAAMLENGYISSIQEGFKGLLSKKGGYYLPPERLSAFDVIGFLRSLGAVPVLAHPFLNLKTEAELCRFLKEAVPQGLAAMETMYPSYSPETEVVARRIAREFGLLESGGSDFHGANKPHISLGRGTGTLAVPASFAENLKKSI